MTDMVTFDGVTKSFGDIQAVKDVSFSVKEGELLALLGPSGSGKTTTLRILGGFERPSSGTVRIEDRDIVDIPPNKRDTTTVFQNYALFPHLTVRENIEFGLKHTDYSKSPVDGRVAEVLELVDLSGFEDRMPDSLSGGQQQRVATARAIAPEPKVMLMDEPLGALDKKLRDQILVDLDRLQQQLEITTIYVTHNQEEALTLADRIAIMRDGELIQLSDPNDVYKNPKNRFVTEFIGDSNIFHGDISKRNGEFVLDFHGQLIHAPVDDASMNDPTLFVRPENMHIASNASSNGTTNSLTGKITQRLYLGSKVRYFVDVEGTEILVDDTDTGEILPTNESVVVSWSKVDTNITDSN